MNFKATKNGTYTITVNPENVEMGYLHLLDSKTGADIDLMATPSSSYSFNAQAGDDGNRFRLVFKAQQGGEEADDDFAFISNGEIIVTGEGILQVIDVLGRTIATRRDAMHCVSTTGLTPGVYVLRLIDGEKVRTQKIVIN